MIKLSFQLPRRLNFDFDVFIDKDTLRQSMVKGFDESRLNSVTGLLRSKLENPSAYRVFGSGKNRGMQLTIKGAPYARILEDGGKVPARKAKEGGFMRFQGYQPQYAGMWFMKKEVRGFTLRAYKYIERGLNYFAKRLHLDRRAIRIEWSQK